MADVRHTNTAHELSDDTHRLILHVYEDEHPPEDTDEQADTLSLDVEVFVVGGSPASEPDDEDLDPIFHNQYWLKSEGDPSGDPIRSDLQQVGLKEPLIEETMWTIELLTELWDTLRYPQNTHL